MTAIISYLRNFLSGVNDFHIFSWGQNIQKLHLSINCFVYIYFSSKCNLISRKWNVTYPVNNLNFFLLFSIRSPLSEPLCSFIALIIRIFWVSQFPHSKLLWIIFLPPSPLPSSSLYNIKKRKTNSAYFDKYILSCCMAVKFKLQIILTLVTVMLFCELNYD